jgi:hypothetical protein
MSGFMNTIIYCLLMASSAAIFHNFLQLARVVCSLVLLEEGWDEEVALTLVIR